MEFTIEGEVSITDSEQYITAEDFMQDKIVKVELFNFRRELIETKTFAGSTTIVFPIDEELSKRLVKGTYYCSLTVLGNLTPVNKTLYYQDDCTLLVK